MKAAELREMSDEQLESAMWFATNLGPVAPLITVPALTLVVAGILYLVAVVALGGGPRPFSRSSPSAPTCRCSASCRSCSAPFW